MGNQNYPTEMFEDLKQLCHARAERYGDKTLFMQIRGGKTEQISYRRYCKDVDALGTAMLVHGLGGKRVILMGENGYEWVTAYMALICGVGTVIPLDTEISADLLASVARESEASAVIYSAACANKVKKACPRLLAIPFFDLDEWIEEGSVRIRSGDRAYLDADIDPHAMAALIYSMGTAEQARGVMLSHRNLCFALSEICKMVRITENDVFLTALPLHYVYLSICGFLCPLYCGASVAFGEGLHALSSDLRTARPTVMLCVPMLLETLYRKLWIRIRRSGMEKRVRSDISLTNAIGSERLRVAAKRRLFREIHESFGGRLRLLISVGTAVDPSVLSGLRELGFLAIQGYGCSECASIVALNRDSFYNDGSVGTSLPGVLVDIYDPQDDGVGEVRVKGENVMLGYFGHPQESSRALRDGWLYTGDLGYMDADGFLYLTGRKKNVIVSAEGVNIFPEELEGYLNATRYVRECAVVGVLNAKSGDVDVVALIRPDLHALEAAFGKHLPSTKLHLEMRKAIAEVNAIVVPKKRITSYLLRFEAFARNTSHKLRREGLCEEVLEQIENKRDLR